MPHPVGVEVAAILIADTFESLSRGIVSAFDSFTSDVSWLAARMGSELRGVKVGLPDIEFGTASSPMAGA